jgi:hypothetical protein
MEKIWKKEYKSFQGVFQKSLQNNKKIKFFSIKKEILRK